MTIADLDISICLDGEGTDGISRTFRLLTARNMISQRGILASHYDLRSVGVIVWSSAHCTVRACAVVSVQRCVRSSVCLSVLSTLLIRPLPEQLSGSDVDRPRRVSFLSSYHLYRR